MSHEPKEGRQHRIQVLVTAEERETFRRAADAQGLSLSSWLRHCGHTCAKQGADRPADSEPPELPTEEPLHVDSPGLATAPDR